MTETEGLLQLQPMLTPPQTSAQAAASVGREPLRVALVVMPFYDLTMSVIGISQLESIVNSDLPDIATATAIYGNHFLAARLGVSFHQAVCSEGVDSGIGDWLFRQVAFPELPDNLDDYLDLYYAQAEDEPYRRKVLELRPQLEQFCIDLIDLHGLASYDVVGFTSMFAQTVPSLAVARLLKERRPEILTVMGGANCEAPMGPALVRNAPMLDYAFSGPGLRSFPQFLRDLAASPRRRPAQLPRGVFNRTTPLDESGLLGDELPLARYIRPDYSSFIEVFEQTRKLADLSPVLTFETSRGCWWGQRAHCVFCGLNATTMGFRSAKSELALEMISDLFDNYYPWCKNFVAVDNIMPEEYPREIFSHFEAPEDAEIFYEVRIKGLDRESLRGLERAGVRSLQPGIESIYTPTLKRMAKGTTSFQNIRFLLDCLDFGIDVAWNLLVGFVDEDDASYRHYLEMIPLLGHVPPPSGSEARTVRFGRYSPYFMRAEEYGLELEPSAHYRLTLPFAAEALGDLAYAFEDVGPAAYRKTLDPWLPQLNQAVADWNSSFYEREAVLIAELQSDGTVAIYDSRSGDPSEYRLSDAASALLLKLHHPAWIGRLGPGERSALDELVARGLVFSDTGRVASIVSWGPDFTISDLAAPRAEPARATAVA